MTPRGLAYWFMDDQGKLDYNLNSKNRSLVFNTQSFSDKKVIEMAKQLDDKFSLWCEIRTKKKKS